MTTLLIVSLILFAAAVTGIIYDRREAISQTLDKIIPLPDESKNQRKKKFLKLKINQIKMEINSKEAALNKSNLEIEILQEKINELEIEFGQINNLGISLNSGDVDRIKGNLQKTIIPYPAAELQRAEGHSMFLSKRQKENAQ